MSNLCTKQTRLLCHSRKTRRWLIYWEIEEIVVRVSCFGLILAFAAGASIHRFLPYCILVVLFCCKNVRSLTQANMCVCVCRVGGVKGVSSCKKYTCCCFIVGACRYMYRLYARLSSVKIVKYVNVHVALTSRK